MYGCTSSIQLRIHHSAQPDLFASGRPPVRCSVLAPYQNDLPIHILCDLPPHKSSSLTKSPPSRMTVLGAISNAFCDAGIFTWDIFLTLGNLVRFSRPVGKVTPEGHPGYGGYWPEYRPPQEGDSRSCCPCLNAMANHGASIICYNYCATWLTSVSGRV